jgi:hypothetical protein
LLPFLSPSCFYHAQAVVVDVVEAIGALAAVVLVVAASAVEVSAAVVADLAAVVHQEVGNDNI